jgi:hypothetical protein
LQLHEEEEGKEEEEEEEKAVGIIEVDEGSQAFPMV